MVKWCRWTCAPQSVVHQIVAILKANPPRRISADTLARHLSVSDAERTMLRIYTIGSYDVPRAKRIERRKENRRLAAETRRRASGAKPREQYLAEARAKAEQRGGVPRSTWYYRQRKQVGQVRSQESSLRHGHGPVQLSTACGNDVRTHHGAASGRTSNTARGRNGRSLPKEEYPLQAVHRPREITAAAKNNGHHRPRQRRVVAQRRKATEQRAVPGIVHLEAISLG